MNYSFDTLILSLRDHVYFFEIERIRKRSGFEGKPAPQFQEVIKKIITEKDSKVNEKFDENAQAYFKGAKIAYETIVTDFMMMITN